MKISYTITMASALLLAAGCAHDERTVRTDETGYSSGHISEYNTENHYSSPSIGGSYSADGSYSSARGGSYSARPDGNYSGTVGADGTYTPYANSDSTAATSAYAGGAGASDETIVSEVRESLRQDPEIALIMPNIQISAHDGAIILSGPVQSEEQKRQIFSRVQGISGVVTVNNQLNVTVGGSNAQNSKTQDPNAPQLNPTGSSDSDHLYRDANKPDNSSNNALNSTGSQSAPNQIYQESNQGGALNATSRTNGESQVFQGSQKQNNERQNTSSQSETNSNNELNPTSRTNSSNQIYHEGGQGMNGQQPNNSSSTNNLDATSRSGGQSQLYQGSGEQNRSNMNSSSNSVNQSTNSLNPTSRQNGSSQIYQNNPGENSQNQNQNLNNPGENSQNQNSNSGQSTIRNQ
jgi:osmotically-inducible protein OsmY